LRPGGASGCSRAPNAPTEPGQSRPRLPSAATADSCSPSRCPSANAPASCESLPPTSKVPINTDLFGFNHLAQLSRWVEYQAWFCQQIGLEPQCLAPYTGQPCSCGRFTIDADHLHTAQRQLVCGMVHGFHGACDKAHLISVRVQAACACKPQATTCGGKESRRDPCRRSHVRKRSQDQA